MMTLPPDLAIALENELSSLSKTKLASAAADLSQRYRSEERDKLKNFILTDHHRLSYLAVRMPATYSVVTRVLEECKERIPKFSPKSLADIGSGPGTATWAALNAFPEIAEATLYEKDLGWFDLGKRLMQKASHNSLKEAIWKNADIVHEQNFSPSDLVILSYVIGELPLGTMNSLMTAAFSSALKVMVIIEPGTPHGFQRIRMVRDQLIEFGAHLIAPCPHSNKCPMEKGDWCHFSNRLERSCLHRTIKNVALGFEDEKFSYLVVSHSPIILPKARILRHPQHHSGHIDFELCTPQSLQKQTISKKHKDFYKKAKKLEWGDVLDAPPKPESPKPESP